jgi:hypothetical protein
LNTVYESGGDLSLRGAAVQGTCLLCNIPYKSSFRKKIIVLRTLSKAILKCISDSTGLGVLGKCHGACSCSVIVLRKRESCLVVLQEFDFQYSFILSCSFNITLHRNTPESDS